MHFLAVKKVGIANQTTMYKEETAAIAKLFERTMLKKFGPEKVAFPVTNSSGTLLAVMLGHEV